MLEVTGDFAITQSRAKPSSGQPASTSAQLTPLVEDRFAFAHDEPFALAAGGRLQPVELQFALYGELNEARDNAILVCHALSGSARVADWWAEMFRLPGDDARLSFTPPFDTECDCIIGINVIGSCYGSTGTRSINPATGAPYAADFPLVSIADIVRAQKKLIEHLGIKRLRAVVGGSIGGMQALQWGIDFPEMVERVIAVGAAPLGGFGLAFNHQQRQAIINDPLWQDGHYPPHSPPAAGLALARSIAMCTYKSPELFDARFARRPNRGGEDPHRSLLERYEVGGYLDYQGTRFVERFDANAYLVLTKAMDNFDPAHDYASERAAFARIAAAVTLVGISSDWLFPAPDVRRLGERIAEAGARVRYHELDSAHGHDAFLADAPLLAPLIGAALGA